MVNTTQALVAGVIAIVFAVTFAINHRAAQHVERRDADKRALDLHAQLNAVAERELAERNARAQQRTAKWGSEKRAYVTLLEGENGLPYGRGGVVGSGAATINSVWSLARSLARTRTHYALVVLFRAAPDSAPNDPTGGGVLSLPAQARLAQAGCRVRKWMPDPVTCNGGGGANAARGPQGPGAGVAPLRAKSDHRLLVQLWRELVGVCETCIFVSPASLVLSERFDDLFESLMPSAINTGQTTEQFAAMRYDALTSAPGAGTQEGVDLTVFAFRPSHETYGLLCDALNHWDLGGSHDAHSNGASAIAASPTIVSKLLNTFFTGSKQLPSHTAASYYHWRPHLQHVQSQAWRMVHWLPRSATQEMSHDHTPWSGLQYPATVPPDMQKWTTALPRPDEIVDIEQAWWAAYCWSDSHLMPPPLYTP